MIAKVLIMNGNTIEMKGKCPYNGIERRGVLGKVTEVSYGIICVGRCMIDKYDIMNGLN
jgi:hypothetical protein